MVDVIGDDHVDGGQGAPKLDWCRALVAGGDEGSEDSVVTLL